MIHFNLIRSFIAIRSRMRNKEEINYANIKKDSELFASKFINHFVTDVLYYSSKKHLTNTDLKFGVDPENMKEYKPRKENTK